MKWENNQTMRLHLVEGSVKKLLNVFYGWISDESGIDLIIMDGNRLDSS
jgi:hypothetical protein